MKHLIKTMAFTLLGLVLSMNLMAGEKITTVAGITSGNKYYIGATTSSTDYYFSVDGSSTSASIAGAAVSKKSDATALTFTAVDGGWTIKFESGNYLGLKNSKDNGKVQVVEDAVTWTIEEDANKSLLKLHPNGTYYIQKNNSGAQFGSYANSQTNVWLEAAGGSSAFTITAQSNNTTYGTVSLSGSVITASPKEGYRYATPAYTVTSGNATVEQDGNKFTVTPTSDCTVRINFEAIPTYTVNWYVNGSVSSSEQVAEGAAIELPEDPDAPSSCSDKVFMGWVDESKKDYVSEDVAPSYISNPVMGSSNVNFYAVFADASGGGAPTWNIVSDVASLTVGSQVVITDAGSTNSAISTTQNSNNRGQATITKSTSPYSTITFTDDAGVQIFEVKEGTKDNTIAFYTGSGYIYAASSSNNYLRTEDKLSDNSSWTVTITENKARISANGTNTRKDLKYNSSSSIFSCYSGGADLFIYKKSGGTTYSNYTTTCGAATDPKINANNVNLAYSATSGEIAYTIDNSTSATLGATITSGDWISNVKVAADKVTFDCTANTTQEARIATIKLSYEGATDKTVTITQADAPYTTMSQVIEGARNGKTMKIAIDNWVVTGVSGSNAYIADKNNEKGILIYMSGHGFTAGDVLNGTVSGVKSQYFNSVIPELTNLKKGYDGLTVTTGGSVTAKEKTFDDFAADDADELIGTVVTLKKAKYIFQYTDLEDPNDEDKYVKVGTNLYTYNSWKDGKLYNATGVYSWSSSLSENYMDYINPRSENDIELITYAITINTVGNGTVTCDADENKACEGEEVTLTITPDAGYRLSSLSVTDADGNPVEVTENKFTMPAGDVTVSAEFEEIQKRDVTLHIGNITQPISQVLDGTPFSEIKPATDPAGTDAGDCANAFMGWATEAINGSTDAAGFEAIKVTSSTVIDADHTNFYAVFATAGEVGEPSYKITTTLTKGKTYIFGAVKAAASATLVNNTTFGAVAFEQAYNSSNPNWGAKVDLTPDANGVIATNATGLTDACKWTLESITDGNYAFKKGEKYLYLGTSTGSTSSAQCGLNTDASCYLENVSSTCKDAFLLHPSSSTNIMLYNTSNGYRMYAPRTYSATMTPYVRFYEYDPGVTYSNYITSCCTKHDVKLTNNGVATGGSFEANPAKACDGTDITLIATPATGYQFVAWSTDPTQTIVDNVFTMPDEDVTVSASFELQKHNVTLHKNDGVNPEATDVTEYTYGDTKNLKTLATLAWSVDGHIFAGWATSAAGKGEYEDGYAFKLEEENDVDFYATWVEESLRPVTYTSVEHLTYANTNPETVNKDAAGFVVAYTVDDHYQVTDAAVTVNGVALTSGITVGQSGLTIEKADGFDGPIVVTPVVAPIIYNVIWEANGEQFATNTVQQGSKPTLPAEEPTTCGETILFMGWTNAEYYDHTTPPTVLFNDAASAREVKAEDAVDGTITYYAVYAEVTSTPVAESTVYTSNIDNTILNDNVYIEGNKENSVVAKKLGTSGTPASSLSFSVPAGTTTITLHAVAWKDKSNVTITMSTEKAGVVITPSDAQAVSANNGATGNSPFSITPADGDFYTFTLSGVTEETEVKISNATERVVLWGINTATTITSDYSTTCLPALTAPTITTAEGEYCGSVDVEITQPAGNPEGSKIMYSTDNTNWSEYSAAVKLEASGTIYAKVVKDPKSTEVVSAAYTVYPAYTLAQAATAASATSQIACLTFTDLLVQARTLSEAFLKASDGQIVLLNKSSHGLQVGDKLVADNAHLNFIKSHDLLQLTSMDGIEKNGTGTPVADVKSITEITSANYGQLVKIMNVTYDATNKKFTDASSNEIAIDAKFFVGGSLPSWPNGGKFNATGVVVLDNNSNAVIAPRNSEDLESLATPLDAPTDFAVTSVNSYRASYSWTAVDNNVGYTLYIYDGATEIYKSNKIGSTIETYAPQKDLEAGHTYTAKLVALGDKAEHSDSQAAEVTFTTNPNAKLNWYVGDNEEPYVTYASQEKVVTPEDPESPCATNYENFVTWYTEEIVSETGQIPALEAAKKVKAGDAAASQAGSAKEYNFYAVFGKIKTAGTDKYVKVTEAITDKDGNEDWRGEFLIGLKEENTETLVVFDGHRPYMDGTTNEPIDDSYNSQSVTLQEEGTVVLATEDINSYRFIFTKSTTEGKYNIQTASGYYIGGKSGDKANSVESSTTTKYDNEISWDATYNEGIEIYCNRYLCYNNDNGQKRFRYMAYDAGNLILYKRTTTNPQYSGYITTCPQTYTITIANNTKGLVEATTTTEILEGTSVKLTATAYDGYTKTGGNWIVKNTETKEVVENLVGNTNYLTMPDYDVTVDYDFQEIKDQFVDNLHGNTTIEKGGANYELPTLSDFSETTGKPSDAFTKFIGWSATSYDSGEPATEQPTILEGSQTATGATYFAVWYNGSGKYITEYCQTDVPTNLHLVAEYHKATSVRIDWNNVDGADKYHIIVMDGEAEIITDADVTESLYDLSGLTPGATYICTVKAHKDCWSDETEEFEFTTKENIQSYAVTINAEGGTYTIDPTLDEGKIQEGKTVTISNIAVTDATTHFFKELTVPEATDLTEVEGSYMFTMPGKAVTINIVFAEYPKVTWKMEGQADVVTSSVRQDNKFVVGTVQSAPATWSYKNHFTEFAGWVTADKCDAEGIVTTAEFITATTEVPATGLTVYGAVAKSVSADMSNTTKVTSNANLDMTAHYVIGTEKSNTPYFFSNYKKVDEALDWGLVTMDLEEETPLVFTLSGTTDALAIQDNRGNYLVTPTKNKSIKMSTTKGTVSLDATGNIISGTSYYFRVNTNANSEGVRWYDSKTCDQAYLYKVGVIYNNLTINPQPDYGRTDLVVGNYGTVCVPYAVKTTDRSGATFWNIETSNAPGSTNPTSVTIVEETGNLEAGKPYIFCATETEMAMFFSDEEYKLEEHEGVTVPANGLFGNLTDATIIINQTEYVPGYFFVLQQKLYECGTNCTVRPNRGWVQAEQIGSTPVHAPMMAPRRVIGNPNVAPTRIDNLSDEGWVEMTGAHKYFRNGTIIIVNEGKLYNAQGQIVK